MGCDVSKDAHPPGSSENPPVGRTLGGISFRNPPKEINENDLPHLFRARYQTGKVLGKGAFATVKLCKNKATGKKAAVKIVDRANLKPEDETGLRQEVAIMQTLHHPHIVQLLDFFEEEKFYYLVIELMEGGELFDRIVKRTAYNEKQARDVVKILVEAIKYCHDNDIVHRDLKPENLLLTSLNDDADLKIADFGFAIRDNGAHNMLQTQCGTPAYIAPEILRGEKYGKSVDMWSIGVITYILLGGYPPFHDDNLKSLFRKIRHGEFTFHPKYWDKVSAEAKDLIKKLLNTDTAERLTAGQVLEHPWLAHDDNVLVSINLDNNLEEFKKYHASRIKFKGAVRTVIMLNRMNKLMGRETLGTNHIRTESVRATAFELKPEHMDDDAGDESGKVDLEDIAPETSES